MILILLLFIITFFIILYILYKNKPTFLNEIVENASTETRFNPTFFLIYDKSFIDENGEKICDRLIIIQPFGWMIWAIQKNVYILDHTSAIQCPIGTSPAIRVTNDIFTMNSECINIIPNNLLNLYNTKPTKVYYDLTESSIPTRFTVLDALNILFKKWILIEFKDVEIDNGNMLKKINNQTLKKKKNLIINIFQI